MVKEKVINTSIKQQQNHVSVGDSTAGTETFQKKYVPQCQKSLKNASKEVMTSQVTRYMY